MKRRMCHCTLINLNKIQINTEIVNISCMRLVILYFKSYFICNEAKHKHMTRNLYRELAHLREYGLTCTIKL